MGADESDDSAAEEVQAEAEAASLTMAQASDGIMTATVAIATAQAETSLFALTATQAAPVALAFDTNSGSSMTMTSITSVAEELEDTIRSFPSDAEPDSPTSIVENLRLTATAFVQGYTSETTTAETASEAGEDNSNLVDSDGSAKQPIFNVYRIFLSVWIRLLEFIGMAR
jgi:hypothetical protein